MPVVQLSISSSVEACPLWKCCSLFVITDSHVVPWTTWIILHVMSNVTEYQENCAINAPSGKSSKTAVLVILFMWSLVLHRTAEPQEALWHLGAQYGTRDCQNCKIVKTTILPKMCQNCQKCAKLKKIQKSPKTALSGLASKVPEGVCVRVFCVYQSVNPGQTGPGALSNLPQPSPADSSQVRA